MMCDGKLYGQQIFGTEWGIGDGAGGVRGRGRRLPRSRTAVLAQGG